MNKTLLCDVVRHRHPLCIGPHETVHTAATEMASRGAGAIVVLDRDDKLIGIVTQADVIERCLLANRDANRTSVAAIMTRDPVVMQHDDTVRHALVVMHQLRLGHLPVANGEHIMAVVSLRDLIVDQMIEMDTRAALRPG